MQNTRRDTRAANSLTSSYKTGYRGRFAPSPTGPLHFGSLVAAMASYLQARQQQGLWFLRIDDIDPPRELAGAQQAILASLRKHGFVWDEEIRYQSSHTRRYEDALHQLQQCSAVYYCTCSRKQILSGLSTTQTGKLVYPGTCRTKNHPPGSAALRFKVQGCVQFHDLLQGTVRQDLASCIGDFVIKRRDGLYAYQLANVADDIADNITQIVRGSDLLDNTPRQIQLTEALGHNICQYMHLPVAVFPDGKKLSKQTHAPALPDHQVLNSLASAWQFLGQADALVYSSVESFWQQAVQQWKVASIPPVPQLLAPISP